MRNLRKKPKKRTKAQIKMFETVAVLVVFMFLIGFGVTFYFMMTKVGAKKESERAASLRIIQTMQTISNLPELDCIRVGVETNNCFDQYKLQALANLLDGNPSKMDEYFDVFGNSEVKINILFPEEGQITLYSNPLEDTGFDLSIYPIMVYDPVKDTFSFAITEVYIYER